MAEPDRRGGDEGRRSHLLSGDDAPSPRELDVARERLSSLLRMEGLLGLVQLREAILDKLSERDIAVLAHVAEQRRGTLAFSHWKAVSHRLPDSQRRIEAEQRELTRLVTWLTADR